MSLLKDINISMISSVFIRPGWERSATALVHAHTCDIKNTYLVCCLPKTFCSVLSHSFMIHSFLHS